MKLSERAYIAWWIAFVVLALALIGLSVKSDLECRDAGGTRLRGIASGFNCSDLGKLIEGVAELTREACAKQCESLLDVSVFWDGGSPFIGDPASAAAIKECTSRIRDMEFPLSGFVRKLQEVGDRDD